MTPRLSKWFLAGPETQALPPRPVIKVGAALAALLFVFLFVTGSVYYASTLEQIAATPLVYDLPDLPHQGPQTRLKVGRSPDCQGAPCWLQPGAATTGWQAVELPSTDLTPYFKNHVGDSAYYRLDLTVPPDLLASNEPLAFSPNWVVHGRYDVYLQGVLVQSGQGLTATGDILYQKVVVSVPRGYVRDGKVLIGIRGTIEPQAIGIQHYGKVLLGPASALNRLHVEAERAMGSYYLVFLLSKGGVFVIFALMFAFTTPLPGMGSFVVYALAVALENLAIGNFLEGTLPFEERVVVYFALKALAATALFSFYLHVLRLRHARLATMGFGAVVFSLALAFAVDYNWGARAVSIANQHLFINSATVFAAAVGTAFGALALAAHGWAGASVRLKAFVAVTGVYLVGLLWCFYIKPYKGFDARAVLDIGLFFYVALTSIIEFGLSQVRLGISEVNVERARGVVKSVLGDASAHAVLTGTDQPVARTVAVAFIDVRHTTSLMRGYGATAVINAVNRLFEIVQQIVRAHGGDINKFMGDTLLVTWGAGGDAAPDALQAVLACLEIRQAVEALKTSEVRGDFSLDVAMGLTLGPAIVGRIGTRERFDFTVIGPTVNAARRLTGLAKEQGVDLLGDEAIYTATAGALVAERVEDQDGADHAYILIGTFTPTGDFVSHSPIWQAQYGWVTTPRLVQGAGGNLLSFAPGLVDVA